MKIILSLNQKEVISEYIQMSIDTFVLGGEFSLHCPRIFSLEEIQVMRADYPQQRFYVSMNALYDQHKMKAIACYLEALDACGIDGLIFQDFGVLHIVRERQYSFDMMYAPETLNTNMMTLNTLQQYGITSAFLSRVIPLDEQLEIAKNVTMPVMFHGHGVEYIAASKRRLLSHYQDASGLTFDCHSQDRLSIQARDSKDLFRIFEDQWGTHIFSDTRLYTLDLIPEMESFQYLYIETILMSDAEAVAIARLYSEGLKSYCAQTYAQDIDNYMEQLMELKSPLARGFLFDQTVYKLEDMRKRDHEKCESNH